MRPIWHTTAMLLVLVALALAPRVTLAHGFRPGVLTLTEREPGVFTLTWVAPMDTAHPGPEIALVLPATCLREGSRLDCGAEGLVGEISFRGLEHQRAPVTAIISHLDGATETGLVLYDAPSLAVGRGHNGRPISWVKLGIAHILGGLDHVAFVLGLLLLLGAHNLRRLLTTITAFTVAHALALALATWGIVVLAAEPVEATIAASIILVAREALGAAPRPSPSDAHDISETITQRWPWLVALLFGIVHGSAFAGALETANLPSQSWGWAVALFNIGVEVGQLAVIGAAFVLMRAFPTAAQRCRVPACYALGSVGVYWLIDRTLALFTGP